MKWPFRKRVETRTTWADAVLRLETLLAEGTYVDGSRTAAAEMLAGLLERAMMLARVSGAQVDAWADVIEAALPMAGRELALTGEALYAVRLNGMALELEPVANATIEGGSPNPESWAYRCTVNSPSSSRERVHLGADVLHFRIGCRAVTPWYGRAAHRNADTASGGAARAESNISNEMSGPVGNLIPAPLEPDSSAEDGNPLAVLVEAIKKLKGGPLLLESMAGGWGNALRSDTRMSADWMAKRLGPDVPRGNVDALMALESYAAMSGGIPGEMLRADASSTARREAWRQAYHSLILPICRAVQRELRLKLDSPGLTLDLANLGAADVQGRARALKSMIDAGIPLEQARKLAGLD